MIELEFGYVLLIDCCRVCLSSGTVFRRDGLSPGPFFARTQGPRVHLLQGPFVSGPLVGVPYIYIPNIYVY